MSFEKPIISALRGSKLDKLPFWFMRQAGRYLPEYRELRKQAGSFLDMAYNPDFATEVTMQPVRRYNMNAAILFSDILVIPHALGRDLRFVENEGPKLNPIHEKQDIPEYSEVKMHEFLTPVCEAINKLQKSLKDENFNDTALMGFSGAPWTLACYMIEGGGSKEFIEVKKWAYNRKDEFQLLIDVLTQAVADYLIRQVKSGVEVLQIFDSWSGVLNDEGFERWVVQPTKTIIGKLKAEDIDVPVIGFPRGAGEKYLSYASQTDVDAVSIDQFTSLKYAKELQKHVIIQGNMDPVYLLGDSDQMLVEAKRICDSLNDKPFIFNLGHGVIKETSPDNMQILTNFLKDYK